MKTTYISILISILFTLASCSEEYLDKKSNKALVVPTTLNDFQALLDNAQDVINIVPGLGIVSCDDAFTTYSAWQGLFTAAERNAYKWATNIYEGENSDDWNKPYQQIFYANVVLDGIQKIDVTPSNEDQWNNLKGSALFIRAHAMLQLAELFTQPYDETRAASVPGIPIRLTADVNTPVKRSSQVDTYKQIVKDLEVAVEFLPANSIHKTRPIKSAAFALLSRTYLFMQNYSQAEEAAGQALELNSCLLDYNELDKESARPIPFMNDEIVYYTVPVSYSYTFSTTTYVDTVLYSRYEDDDLRKEIFFRLRLLNRYTFKGTYTQSAFLFGGIANDEVYLNRAESRARLGNIDGALEDLNTLLITRWKANAFTPITESNPESLLSIILEERQKELLFRSTRWSDLRRLNQDSRFAKTLKRSLNGIEYTLLPNDLKYTLPIPNQEILTSGIEQNPR
jgi:starch-binding outer membrane protein, SusD/RagB family